MPRVKHLQSWSWWRIGKVDAFRPEDRGFESLFRLPRRDLGQVLHLHLPVALRRVNSDTVSIAVVGSIDVKKTILRFFYKKLFFNVFIFLNVFYFLVAKCCTPSPPNLLNSCIKLLLSNRFNMAAIRNSRMKSHSSQTLS